MQITTNPTPATDGILADVLAELPGVKSNGRGGYDFPCTQEHKKRQRAGWLAVLGGKVRVGCYNDASHNDALWRQHVGPHLVRHYEPKDWIAPLAVAGVSRVASGQFADAIIYGPIWAGPYLLPIEERELDRRDELAELAGFNLLLADITASMGKPTASMGLAGYRALPTIADVLRRPPPTPIERANRAGRIGGDATPTAKSGGYVVLDVKDNVTARFRKMPDRFVDYPCLTPNWIIGTDYIGESYDIPKPCEKCINCVAYAQERKIVRWDNGRADVQDTFNVTGAANADEARKWTGALSKALGKLPDHSSLVTEDGEILLVFAEVIDFDLMFGIFRFASAEHGNCKRPSKTWPSGRPKMQCGYESGPVSGVDLAAFVGSTRTAQGERRHVSWRLHGDAFALAPREDDFAFGPGRPLPDGESPPAKPEVSDAVVKSRTRWRKAIAPRTRQTMREGERAMQAMAWCAGKNLITYTGPPKLLRQYADFKAGKRDYESAWDYVAAMVGDDPPTPWRQPRDCKGCGFPYYPTPGRRQCANCAEGE